jgi:hypothetical protein
MLADVGINTSVALWAGSWSALKVLTLLTQTLFLGVVVGGFPLLWSLQTRRGRSEIG